MAGAERSDAERFAGGAVLSSYSTLLSAWGGHIETQIAEAEKEMLQNLLRAGKPKQEPPKPESSERPKQQKGLLASMTSAELELAGVGV